MSDSEAAIVEGSEGAAMSTPTPTIPHDVIVRYTNGDCSDLAAAFKWLNGWEPLNLGGHHVVVADPDGEHAWDITGRQPLDYLESLWGAVEPWDPWVSWNVAEPDPEHLAWAVAVEALARRKEADRG